MCAFLSRIGKGDGTPVVGSGVGMWVRRTVSVSDWVFEVWVGKESMGVGRGGGRVIVVVTVVVVIEMDVDVDCVQRWWWWWW